MPSANKEQILRLDDGSGSTDGRVLSFTVVTQDGVKHPFRMSHSDMPKLLDYLISLSQHVATQTGTTTPPKSTPSMTPIDVVSLGVAHGRSAEEVLLAIHTGVVTLAFATTPNELAGLRDNLNRILVPTGSAPARKN